MYFGAINVSSSMKRQLAKNSISVVIDLAFGNCCDKKTQYRLINSATVVHAYGSQCIWRFFYVVSLCDEMYRDLFKDLKIFLAFQ